MTIKIFTEGGAKGPKSKNASIECQKSFKKLFENAGLNPSKFSIIPCGGRSLVHRNFCIEYEKSPFPQDVMMLVDSEDPIANIYHTWNHVKLRKGDSWVRPKNADDNQILFMSTCMETWIVADHESITSHYGSGFRKSALPSLTNLEDKPKPEVQAALKQATSKCQNKYIHGEKSTRTYETVSKLNPNILRDTLPSFERTWQLLNQKLK